MKTTIIITINHYFYHYEPPSSLTTNHSPFLPTESLPGGRLSCFLLQVVGGEGAESLGGRRGSLDHGQGEGAGARRGKGATRGWWEARVPSHLGRPQPPSYEELRMVMVTYSEFVIQDGTSCDMKVFMGLTCQVTAVDPPNQLAAGLRSWLVRY